MKCQNCNENKAVALFKTKEVCSKCYERMKEDERHFRSLKKRRESWLDRLITQ